MKDLPPKFTLPEARIWFLKNHTSDHGWSGTVIAGELGILEQMEKNGPLLEGDILSWPKQHRRNLVVLVMLSREIVLRTWNENDSKKVDSLFGSQFQYAKNLGFHVEGNFINKLYHSVVTA